MDFFASCPLWPQAYATQVCIEMNNLISSFLLQDRKTNQNWYGPYAM